LSVQGNSDISGNTTLAGTLNVSGNSSLSTLTTSGKAILNSLSVQGNSDISGNTTLAGTLNVSGNSSLSTLTTSGKATLKSLSVQGNSDISGKLYLYNLVKDIFSGDGQWDATKTSDQYTNMYYYLPYDSTYRVCIQAGYVSTSTDEYRVTYRIGYFSSPYVFIQKCLNDGGGGAGNCPAVFTSNANSGSTWKYTFTFDSNYGSSSSKPNCFWIAIGLVYSLDT